MSDCKGQTLVCVCDRYLPLLVAYLPYVVSLSGESLLLNITNVNNPTDLHISQDFWKWFRVKSPCLKSHQRVYVPPEEITA